MASAPRTGDRPGQVPLEVVLTTAELARRPSRAPDYQTENLALVALAKAMVESPQDILQRLVETAVALCHAGSSGVSIIEPDGGAEIFRWHALTGALATHLWGTTPRNFSPCGTVVDTDSVQLMSLPERHYEYFAAVKPQIVEALLVPFDIAGCTVGTVWVVTHDDGHQFDAEDARIIANLGEFASAAYQVKSSMAKIEESDRFKDEFMATLAHELRNPLSAMQCAAHFVSHRFADLADSDLQKISEVNQRQLTAMTRMVDDLGDVSRIASNKIVLRRARISVASIIRGAVETTQARLTAAAHTLSLDLPQDEVCLIGDAARLTQLVGNLLNNAAKYTPREGRINVTVRVEGPQVIIQVRDNGIGLAAEELVRIFDAFAQVEAARSRSQGGLGIGLSLVKRLTELHEGTVEAFSRGVGQGSEFVVRLPVASGDAAEAEADFSAAPQSLAHAHQNGVLRILIVDDDRDSADALALLLQMEGHQLRVCYDEASALLDAAQFSPDFTLQDISMPGIGGHELARRLHADLATQSTVLIALSGHGRSQDVRDSEAAGFAHHLVKPIDLVSLRRILGGASRDASQTL